MVSIRVDTKGIELLAKALTGIAYEKDRVLRSVATTMRAELSHRIHTEGKAADGSLISPQGYSPAYLEERVEKFNRTNDSKVVLSLTRQMENDFKVIETENGYGLGFSNPFNYEKSQWNEQRFKKIYDLTPDEIVLTQQTAEAEVIRILNALP